MKAKKLQLKNGLKVVLVESHKSPVISVQMWVKTGSADERKGEEGLSHFIEHLLFKGTKDFKVGEIAKVVEGSGGELNAYTSFDQTVFYVTISKNYAEVALHVISEMMGYPEFDPKEIDKERGVVLEEIKRGLDNPSRQSYQMLFSTCYPGHAYSVPVIGYEQIIKDTPAGKIAKFFKERYNPTTMTLLVVGDFRLNEMKREVEKHFAALPKNKFRKVVRKKAQNQSRPRFLVQEKPFEQTHVHLAWPIPKFNHKDISALELLATILGYGDSSRLVNALRLKRPLAQSVGASCFTPIDPGFFSISFLTNETEYQNCLDAVSDTLKEFAANGATQDELNRALIGYESEDLYSLETVDGLSRKIGNYEFMYGDFNAYKEQIKKLRAVTVADLQRVFFKYLSPKKINGVVMTKQNGSVLEEALIKWSKNQLTDALNSKAVKSKRKPAGKPVRLSWTLKTSGKDVETLRISHPRGARILIRANPDSPVVSLKAAVLGGLRYQKPGEDGLTEMTSRLWTAETSSMSEKEISEKMDSVAGSLEAFGGRNSMGLSMTVLQPFAKKMAPMFFEVLGQPTFPTDKLEREKTILKQLIKQRDDNPGQVVSQLFLKNMFGNHPYSTDLLGQAHNLDQLDTAKVKGFWQSLLNTPNLCIAISGDIRPKDWEEEIGEALKSMPQHKVPDLALTLKYPTSNQHAFQTLNKEQTHIIYGFPGLTIRSEDRFALQVIQSVLAGQGGRLFLELRDKESLAYSVAPVKMEGIEGGYFGAYIGCSPEKGEKAIQMMKKEFEKLMQTPVSERELVSAKNYLIGRHDIDLQRTSSVVGSIIFDELYGNDYNETFKFAQRIEQVTAKHVQDLAQRLFAQPAVISAVGPRQPW